VSGVECDTASFPALAQKRVALVIGNSTYKHAGELANPKNDVTQRDAQFRACLVEHRPFNPFVELRDLTPTNACTT